MTIARVFILLLIPYTIQAGNKIDGQILLSDGKPPDLAHVVVEAPHLANALTTVQADADGRFTVQLPEPGFYILWAGAPRYVTQSIPMVLEAMNDEISLVVTLAPYVLLEDIPEAQVVGAWNDYRDQDMIKMPDGTFVYEVEVQSDTFAYVIDEAEVFDREIPGTMADYFVFDSDSRNYRSVLRVKPGKIKIVFDPGLWPKTENGRPRITFDQEHRHLEELFRIVVAFDEASINFNHAWRTYRRTHENMRGFEYQPTEYRQYLESLMRSSADSPTRQFAALHLASSARFSWPYHPIADQRIIELAPPESPLWSMHNQLPAELAAELAENWDEREAFLRQFEAKNPDRSVRAEALAALFRMAMDEGRHGKLPALAAELKSKYGDISDIRRTLESVQGIAAIDSRPSAIPDRVVLTWAGDPATSQAVTWRTDTTVTAASVELAIADASPQFTRTSEQITAKTDTFRWQNTKALYHSVNLTELQPATLYAYRVGSLMNWSEWFHFRTASREPEPFSFVYFGDAQNEILALWSRAIRSAYSEAPKARFMIHAGDLVNDDERDREWGEWFRAGGWIHAMMPGIPTPGNHEYGSYGLSPFWRPQFSLPENGVEGLEESVYYIDYQGVRIISLNSNENLEKQVGWLESVLATNNNRWTVITFHHPVFSSARGRDNPELRELWKPLFDKYRVDLVLQGHDHSYARGRNLPHGVNQHEPESGTMYVVSVSGPKMYPLTSERWMDRAAENTQLFQVISVTRDTLHYKAMTATGELYDAFDLVKQQGQVNKLVDRIPPNLPERTFESR